MRDKEFVRSEEFTREGHYEEYVENMEFPQNAGEFTENHETESAENEFDPTDPENPDKLGDAGRMLRRKRKFLLQAASVVTAVTVIYSAGGFDLLGHDPLSMGSWYDRGNYNENDEDPEAVRSSDSPEAVKDDKDKGKEDGSSNSGKTKSSVEEYKRTRKGDDPEVIAVFDSNSVVFPFSEKHEYFQYDGAWTLDLNGNTIELVSMLELDTDVTVINGTMVTFDDAYIVNKKSLHLGYEKEEDGSLMLLTQGIGVENQGTLDLKNFQMTINSGTGIKNTGTLSDEFDYYDFSNGETGNVRKTITVNSGLFLENRSVSEENILSNVHVTGASDCYVDNYGILGVEWSDFSGSRGTFFINRESALTNPYKCMFHVNGDGAVGMLNEGQVGNYSVSFFVDGGTGLINKGKYLTDAGVFVKNGLGVDNYGELNTFYAELEGGTGIINEKEALLKQAEVKIKAGAGIINRGLIKDTTNDYYDEGYDRTHEQWIDVLADAYKETAFVNEEGGEVMGSLHLFGSGFDGGCLLDNRGKLGLFTCKVGAGLAMKEVRNWDYRKNNPLDYNNYNCEITWQSDQKIPVKDATIIKDSGAMKVYAFEGVLFGAGSGEAILYKVSGASEHLVEERFFVGLHGSGGVGLFVESGSKFSGGDIRVYMGSSNPEETYAFSPLYGFENESYSNMLCSKNTGGMNYGSIEKNAEKNVNLRVEQYGDDCIGFLNEGTLEINELYVTTCGNRNTGFDNRTSLDADTVYAKVPGNRIGDEGLISGGNTALYNAGILRSGRSVHAFAGDYPDLEKMTIVEGADGKDIGLRNAGTIEATGTRWGDGDCAISIQTRTPAGIGLYDENYIKATYCLIEAVYGTGMLCAEKSVTYLERISVRSGTGTGEFLKYDATGLALSGLMEVSGEYSSSDGMISITARDGKCGVLIDEGGSLSQPQDENHYATISTKGKESVGVSNYGHLALGRVELKKWGEEKGLWTSVISDHGVFSFLPYEIDTIWSNNLFYYVSSETLEIAIPGPWKGVKYFPCEPD